MSTHPLEFGLGASRHFNHEKALVGAFSVITNLRIAFVRISTSLGSGSPLAVDPSDKIQRQFSSAAA